MAVRFYLQVRDEKIAAASFESTTCVTLVAYCELLCHQAERHTLRDAIALSPAELAAALPDVPPVKRDRALLATAAFQSAIAQIVCGAGVAP